MYSALRDKLVEAGMPREQIRFIHEARNDRDKHELFEACRDGRISVLIGSTEKMGVGTNVQHRAVALHHLDCPWRPADLQQREGRLVRQGNRNTEVRIFRHITERSFDAYSWQTVTRKATFIAQVMRGSLDVREIDDIGDSALTYNEVKALAAGNPLLLDHAQAKAELTRLERLERSHRRGLDSLRLTLQTAHSAVAAAQARAAAADAALARRVDVHGERFALTLGATTYQSRTDAATALRAALRDLMADAHTGRGEARVVGRVGGFDIQATVLRDVNGYPSVQLDLLSVPQSTMTARPIEVEQQDLVTRLTNRLNDLENLRARATADIEAGRHDIAHAQAQLGTPFRHARALADARDHFTELDARLAGQAAPPSSGAGMAFPQPPQPGHDELARSAPPPPGPPSGPGPMR